jgi:hypothetical protein
MLVDTTCLPLVDTSTGSTGPVGMGCRAGVNRGVGPVNAG